MSFRDDRDALLERVEGLERENEAARRERDEARRSAADVPNLEARLREAEDELAVRRRGESPRIQRLVVLGGIGVVGVLAAAGALVAMDVEARGTELTQVQRTLAGTQQEEATLRDRLAFAESEVATLRSQQEAAEHAPAPTDVPLPPPAEVAPTEVAPEPAPAPAGTQTAHVTHATGPAPVRRGATCDVTLTAGVDDCRARVRCGEVGLYPDPGREGFFPCEFDRQGPVHGADVHRTELSGDPRLDFDRARGTLEISDGVGDTAWAVTLHVDP